MQTDLTGGASLRTPMSYEEYAALGETKYTEFDDGLVIVNPPTRRHVLAAKALTRLLDDACPPGYEVLPEWGWDLTPQGQAAHFQPDVMIAPIDAPDEDELRVPPLLVVEIESPSTRDLDRGRKQELYGDAGLTWYWRLDLEGETLTVLSAWPGGGQVLYEVQHITAPGAVTNWPVKVFIDPARLR